MCALTVGGKDDVQTRDCHRSAAVTVQLLYISQTDPVQYCIGMLDMLFEKTAAAADPSQDRGKNGLLLITQRDLLHSYTALDRLIWKCIAYLMWVN